MHRAIENLRTTAKDVAYFVMHPEDYLDFVKEKLESRRKIKGPESRQAFVDIQGARLFEQVMSDSRLIVDATLAIQQLGPQMSILSKKLGEFSAIQLDPTRDLFCLRSGQVVRLEQIMTMSKETPSIRTMLLLRKQPDSVT